ncbi:unnamed protein product [Urochloa humidicola]
MLLGDDPNKTGTDRQGSETECDEISVEHPEPIAADDAISNVPHRRGVENIPPVAHSGSKRLSAAGGTISESVRLHLTVLQKRKPSNRSLRSPNDSGNMVEVKANQCLRKQGKESRPLLFFRPFDGRKIRSCFCQL